MLTSCLMSKSIILGVLKASFSDSLKDLALTLALVQVIIPVVYERSILRFVGVITSASLAALRVFTTGTSPSMVNSRVR